MDFFLQIDPPTATAQEKQVRVVRGKPLFYDPVPVKEAKSMLVSHLLPHRPDMPLDGPLALSAVWLFPKGKKHIVCYNSILGNYMLSPQRKKLCKMR